MAAPRTPLKLRRFRQRFGIRAPRLAIRTHVEWRWRALVIAVAVALAGGLGIVSYDAGRRASGNYSATVEGELAALSARVAELDGEAARLRSVAGSAESSLQIERAAQQQLAKQVRALEAENGALKDDLAFFEGLVPSSEAIADTGVRIHRLRVEADATAGQFRYRMLLVNNGGKPLREFRGALQLVVKVRRGNEDAMITFPPEADRTSSRFQIEIKHFQRAEGSFTVPPGALVKSVEARLIQDGEVRARQSVNL
jgi:hypothetical protein